jgi:hypothetical protein
MSTVIVRYRTKPERADENQRLVEKVFAELAERRPAGFRYVTFRLDDGNSFLHIATEEPADHTIPLTEVAAFQAFLRDIADRCEEQPVPTGATVVGSYRVFAD